MELSETTQDWTLVFVFYGAFLVLSCFFPNRRAYPLRLLYVGIALTISVLARRAGINSDFLLYAYLSKSYFLLNRRGATAAAALVMVPWIASKYLEQVDWVQRSSEPIPLSVFDPMALTRFVLISLAAYLAASTFTLIVSAMVVNDQKNRQQAAMLSQQIESLSADLERTRIARELHDSLGHTLTDLDIQLAVAQELRQRDPEQADRAVDIAKMLVGQCIEDASRALQRMRQSDFDLNQALSTLLAQVQQTSNMQVKWKLNLPELSVYQSYQIYCILKEAVRNVQKHAQASHLTLYAMVVANDIVLDIEDDGIGAEMGSLYNGFGIQGIRERVQLLGGQLEIQTALSEGMRLQVTLPL
ncbi:signal transduction histidine kinase [Leptolyngbya sp. Heron Island J]|nr:signal transduction histidine kinase [Leptolyngbya sp. Heron Island J]